MVPPVTILTLKYDTIFRFYLDQEGAAAQYV